MTAKKKASGVNIPETQRGRQGGGDVQVKLRLPEEVRDDLHDLARRWGLTVSGTVALLVERALESNTNPKEESNG